MIGRRLLFLLLLAAVAQSKKKVLKSALNDQPRFSCFITEHRRVTAECAGNQHVCYYTRRMPRFASDFRPDDLVGRGCDVPRNKDADSCQVYTKGLDTFMRCECGVSDCNTHYWHGFATSALHHRQLLKTGQNEAKKRRVLSLRSPVDEARHKKYMDWYMCCFYSYILLQAYYFIVFLYKWYKFQKRAVLVRAVLAARGNQHAEMLLWKLEYPEITIHNFHTSFIKMIDGFIRYRSLGSLPHVDINQLRATWLLGRQEIIRNPEWVSKMHNRQLLERKAIIYNNESLDVARVGIETFMMDLVVKQEMDNIKNLKRLQPVVQLKSDPETKKSSSKKSDKEEDENDWSTGKEAKGGEKVEV